MKKLNQDDLVAIAIGAAVTAFVSVFVQWVLDLSPWALPLGFVAGLAIWAAVKFRRQLWALLCKALPWLGSAALGVLVALPIFVFTPRIFSMGDLCDFSTELRVVTGPESVTALRAAADRYVAEKSGDGCRDVTITVTANSSVTALRRGFVNGWLKSGSNPAGSGSAPQRVAFLSPRPDIWIPDSTVTADHVRDYVENQSAPPSVLATRTKADLRIDGTVGTSPMVVGFFTDEDRSLPSQTTLSDLFGRLSGQQRLQTLVRPSPDGSEAALLTIPILYQALTEGDPPLARSDAEAEEMLNARERIAGDSTTLQTSDATALLCRFRAAAARGEQPPPGLAVVVPEKALAAYNHGDALGDVPGTACPGGPPPSQWRMSAYHTSDLPVLDHPFVQVRWPGEYTARRQRAIEDFREWLGTDALTRFGFRTASGRIAPLEGTNPLLQALPGGGEGSIPGVVEPGPLSGRPGCAGSLQEALDCYVAARPVSSVNLLVDVSGSMVQLAGPDGQRSLLRAQEVAEDIVSAARPRDQLGVRPFSTEAPPVGGARITIAGDEERAVLQAQIQQLAVAGSDMPLTDAIEEAAGELRAGSHNLVLLTDGQVPRSNPAVAERAPALAAKLRAENPALRVFIVLVGPRECGDEPLKPLADAFGRGSCIPGSAIPTEDVAEGVISTILWGEQ